MTHKTRTNKNTKKKHRFLCRSIEQTEPNNKNIVYLECLHNYILL